MTSRLQYTKELTVDVAKQVTEQLRESYVADVTAIVKDYLNKNELYTNSEGGWITRAAAAKKYQMSVKTVGDKLKLFKDGVNKIERKKMGRHTMLNEKQFLKAFDQKGNKVKLKFLNNEKTA